MKPIYIVNEWNKYIINEWTRYIVKGWNKLWLFGSDLETKVVGFNDVEVSEDLSQELAAKHRSLQWLLNY